MFNGLKWSRRRGKAAVDKKGKAMGRMKEKWMEQCSEREKDSTGSTNGSRLGSGYNLLFENRIVREWLSTEEAASYLSVSPNALRIMVYRGQIPAYKFGRRLRFKTQDCRTLFQPKGV
jgi:excisionase family DNA binding protein